MIFFVTSAAEADGVAIAAGAAEGKGVAAMGAVGAALVDFASGAGSVFGGSLLHEASNTSGRNVTRQRHRGAFRGAIGPPISDNGGRLSKAHCLFA